MTYLPRKQSAKFLDGDCPKGVLAIYDNGGKTFDRYTIFYSRVDVDRGVPWLSYLAASESPASAQGFGIHEQMTVWQARDYRARVYRQSARWSDLPEEVKAVVRRDVAA